MAKVDINTKMITLLGDPLKQSFAAQMQNCGYCLLYTSPSPRD